MVQSPPPGTDPQHDRVAPVRTCVGCRRRALIGELLRVVAADGRLIVDERRRLPGRGAWLHPVPDCLAKAERRRAFPRALRVPGSLDAQGVHERLERLAEE
ncbi:YlxR family protein [Amycolatopsis oliviviridis]|uniref:YlxR family protein n=1 Tax=Amycolatopsis oliviviridis TaxID=1471590 RepID=UPI00174E6376|nr:YlxR family protein [Amycolatopsis oliviviridis]